MVDILKRLLTICLTTILLLTASLFFFSSGGASWLASSAEALVTVMRQTAETNPIEKNTIERNPDIYPVRDFEVAVTDEEKNVRLFPSIPILNSITDSSQQTVVILAEGSEANIWLLNRDGDTFEVILGPIYARIGGEGLTNKKQPGDGKTPMGVTLLQSAYASQNIENTTYPVTLLNGGDVWVTDPYSVYYNKHTLKDSEKSDFSSAIEMLSGPRDICIDIGYNLNGNQSQGHTVFIKAEANLKNATDGDIAISYDNMLRLLKRLDSEAMPVALTFKASEFGFELEEGMDEGFVFLDEAVPGIIDAARYAGNDNFMGRPIDGYFGNRVVVSKEIAQALKLVQEELRGDGLGLIVYDGYRPERAVQDIFTWLEDKEDTLMKEGYYPEISKESLRGIYLAEHSPHTRGVAVDLSIYNLSTGEELDMGTGFDFFSEKSWYDSKLITDEQYQNRRLLREVMQAAGFYPYEKEWWHFNYYKSSGSKKVYDFVIPQ